MRSGWAGSAGNLLRLTAEVYADPDMDALNSALRVITFTEDRPMNPMEAVQSAWLDGGATPTDGTVVAGPGRIRGVIFRGGTAGGLITLEDGVGGTELLKHQVTGGTSFEVIVPGSGISFSSEVYADFAAANQQVTVLYSVG